jgi:opacity protein-like surface antigen
MVLEVYGRDFVMSKSFYVAIAITLAISSPAGADDLSVSCTLRSGNTVPLTVSGKKVLKSGQLLKNFDQKTFSEGETYIRFAQDFGSYGNAWTINRNNLQISFKTILKADASVVLEENGSCTSVEAGAQQPQKKAGSALGIPAVISAWLRR